jgi:hypothetical protein
VANAARRGGPLARWQGRIPLFVGVTGHRDLHPEESRAIAPSLREFVTELRAALPSTPIMVLSRLAEGADQLVASIAIAAGCESACVLPLERTAYRESFGSDAARAEFDRLATASVLQELPDAEDGRDSAERGYARAGYYIARHATILVALWDGADSVRPGSTADVLRIRAASWVGPGAGALCLIPVRRRDPPAVAAAGPDARPEARAVPAAEHRLSMSAREAIDTCGWRHAEEFNAAVLAGGARISGAEAPRPFGAIADSRFADVVAVLSAARTLATDAQGVARRHKLLLQIIGFLAAIAFVVIFKTSGARWLLWVYLALLAAALVLRTLMRRQAVHRRYLDYRCLTEGLRVVLFWRLAGLHSDPGVHTVTVRLVSRQDPSFMWIASALSGLAGWINRLHVPPAFDGCDFAARHWLGSESSDEPGAQIPYYRRAASHRRRVAEWLDRVSRVTLVCGVATAASLAVLPAAWVGPAAPVLLAFMGFLPLVSSTAGAIADLPAELGIARQYEGMANLLENAGQRLAATVTDVDRRQVLFEVGTAALAEHSFWRTVFRERAPESRMRM